jgi:hypothetical protein
MIPSLAYSPNSATIAGREHSKGRFGNYSDPLPDTVQKIVKKFGHEQA